MSQKKQSTQTMYSFFEKSQSNCLMCNESIHQHANLKQYLFDQDPLCPNCRLKWLPYNQSYPLNSLRVYSLFVYNDAISSAIRQYKECMDEALAPIFLYPYKKFLQNKYAHATLIGMPSSLQKKEERGFNHIEKMFNCLNIPFYDEFEKTVDIKQAKQSKKDRKKIDQIIRLKENSQHILADKIILVDDICTTGATLEAAYHCLEMKANKIEALTLCVHPLLVEKRRSKLFERLYK